MTRTRLRWLFVTPFGTSRRGTVLFRVMPMAQALAQQGVRVRVLVAGWDTPEFSGRIEVRENLNVIALPFRRSLLNAGHAGLAAVWLEMTRWALYLARSWHPDVIHLVKPITVPFLFLAVARGGLWGRKRWPPHIFLDCDDLEQAWRTGVPMASLWRWIGRWLESWAWRAADHLTVASHFLLNEIPRRMTGQNQPIHQLLHRTILKGQKKEWIIATIPNVTLVRGRPQGVRPHPRLVVPTRLMDIRPAVMARWLKSVADAMPRVSILVVGPDKPRAAEFRREIIQLGIQDRVAVLLFQDVSAYHRVVASARVGLYAVEDTPANRAKCPVRVVDMMALGVPVVAVDVGEPEWLLRDTGVLVAPEGEAIARAVYDLWHAEERRRDLARRAQERARQQFGLEAMAARLLMMYDTVVERSGRP